MPEVPQGVAQRVISKAREGYQQVRSVAVAHDQSTVIKLNRLDAMEELCAELSAEARRVWAETKKSRDSLTDEHMGTDYYGINCAMQGMQLLAHRLGLDLNEPEDSDE